MIKNTPAMGWNTWNTFAEKINEELILRSADVLAESGLRECGYDYIVIDDCWAERSRDANGRLQCDKSKFPHGMKYVADYVHAKGLKFGMYSCCGTMTCQAYPASCNYEYIDAETFAEWGVDFLKFDYCYKPEGLRGKDLYRRMGLALANCGRDILFSGCSWGADNTPEWIRTAGANMWRSTPDINDSFESVKTIIKQQYGILPYGGKDCFNDMDMLIVGMDGKGNVGLKGCTCSEYALHFAVWCLLGSPLMIGCDIRELSDEAKAILTNKKLIAINQDERVNQPYIRLHDGNDDLPIIVRYMANGDIALGFINMTDGPAFFWVPTDDIGLPTFAHKTLIGEEIFSGDDVTVVNGTVQRRVEAHSAAVFRLRFVKK